MFRQKSHNNCPGKFGKIWVKILRTPKNLLANAPTNPNPTKKNCV